MKNTFLIAGAVAVLAVAGIGVYAYATQNASMQTGEAMEKSDTAMMKKDETLIVESDTSLMAKDESMMAKDEAMEPAADTAMMKKTESYVAFSPAVLNESASQRRVLFFYANWCPTCNAADASFSSNISQIPSDVTLIKVNYNDTETDQAEKDLARKYAVTYQHTFVQIDANGNEVTKWNGGQIKELINNLE